MLVLLVDPKAVPLLLVGLLVGLLPVPVLPKGLLLWAGLLAAVHKSVLPVLVDPN
jgi:hypothetical protein